jgi:hypothetical protein
VNEIPQNVLYYGREDPLPKRVGLRAGPLDLVYEAGDIRYVMLGEHEILRWVYVTVRGAGWRTITSKVTEPVIEIEEDSFRVSFEAEHRQGDVDFLWQGEITGDSDGTLSFCMDGVARSTFMRNRIGFCVLYPASLAGTTCLVKHTDCTQEQAILPIRVNPGQPLLPFYDMGCLSHKVRPGLWAEVQFEGELFEIEDQRNWTDASFKTYCTPLKLPYPVKLAQGARIVQSVRLKLNPGGVTLRLAVDPEAQAVPLPPIGLSVPKDTEHLTTTEVARLKALNLSHLRVDLDLFSTHFAHRIHSAWLQAQALDLPLEVAVPIKPGNEDGLRDFRRLLDEIKPRLRRWLIYPEREKGLDPSTFGEILALARQYLESFDTSVEWCAGTNSHFIFLNRTRPPLSLVDAITFAISGEVHAFDNSSLTETLEIQGLLIRNARDIGKGAPVVVSPVTFKPRLLTSPPTAAMHPVELPSEVDPRQMSLFGAAWTMGSIKYLAENGAHSMTFFETLGWKGVMETMRGSALPEIFHSIPGGVHPMYHVFAAIGEFINGNVIPCRSSDNLRADGLVLQKQGKRRILLANMTSESQTLIIDNAGAAKTMKALDITNVADAIQCPGNFRQRPGVRVRPKNGTLIVKINPYALTWIDD